MTGWLAAMALACFLVLNACGSSSHETPPLDEDPMPIQTPTYEIGDSGPGGGIVFYLDPDDPRRGLEAAREDQVSAEWGCFGTDVAAIENLQDQDLSNTDDNSGAANTDAIIAGCGFDTAAGVARAYVWPNAQTDGFLPNREELNLLYVQKDNVGGFATGGYWSSSEYFNIYSWSQFFSNGDQDANHKFNTWVVRTVRAF